MVNIDIIRLIAGEITEKMNFAEYYDYKKAKQVKECHIGVKPNYLCCETPIFSKDSTFYDRAKNIYEITHNDYSKDKAEEFAKKLTQSRYDKEMNNIIDAVNKERIGDIEVIYDKFIDEDGYEFRMVYSCLNKNYFKK